MKKIIALVIAILMMAAIAVPAMATKGYDETSTGEGYNQSIVEFGVKAGYTITIPQKITFEGLVGEAEVTASSVVLAGNETLSVSVSSTQYQKQVEGEESPRAAWVMTEVTGKSAPVDYTIKNGGVAVANNGVILTVTADDDLTDTDDVTSGYTDTVTLDLATPGTSQVGTYQDTLTFAVAVATNG